MEFKNKLKEIEATLLGNRIAVIGNALLFGGFGAAAIRGCGQDLGLPTAISMLGGWASASLAGCGVGTTEIYNRTMAHLQQFNRLDERFFDKVMKINKTQSIFGYCQLQGMYLACRDYSQETLPEFYKLKAERTKNIIPNF